VKNLGTRTGAGAAVAPLGVVWRETDFFFLAASALNPSKIAAAISRKAMKYLAVVFIGSIVLFVSEERIGCIAPSQLARPAEDIRAFQRITKFATGDDAKIPRMFVFGEKVGAYTMNNLGDHRFNTVDVWESRFIRSYFKTLFDKH
jgi:hypothetical protein